jgi:transposase
MGDARQRIDALFANERAINGQPANERRALRQERSKPLAVSLEAYLRDQRAKLSPKHDLAKAMSYFLSRWEAFTRFLDDGQFVSRTMLPKGRCAVWPSEDAIGPLPEPLQM